MLSAILTFVSLMVMTRYVGEQYGVMMWGWSIVSAFAAVTDLGASSAHVKYLSEGNDQNTCFSTYLALKLCLTGVMSVLTIASLYIGSNTGNLSPEVVAIIVIFLLYFIVQSVQNTAIQTFAGRLENGKTSIITLSEYAVRTIFLIILAFMGASALHLSLAYAAGMIVSLLISIVLLRGIRVRFVKPAYIKMYLMFMAPLAVSVGLVAFLNSFDKVLIGTFNGTGEVAYYAAVAGIVWGFSMLSNSLNAVMLPQLARYNVRNDIESAKKLLWKTQKYLFMFLLPTIAMFLVLGLPICSVLFGEAFEPSGKVLAGMSGVICFYAYVGLGAQVLFSTNRGGLYTKTTIVSALLSLILFFVLIPDELFGISLAGMGGVGAAIALSIGYITQAIMISVAVKRVAGAPPYPRLWKHATSFLASLIVLLLFRQHLDAHNLIIIVAGGLLCLGTYFAVMALLREFGKNDVRFFKNALSAKGLYKSLSEEFGDEQ